MHQLIRVRRASRKPGPGPGPSPDRTGTETGTDILILTCWELGNACHCCMVDSMACRKPCTSIGLGGLEISNLQTIAFHCCCFGVKTMVDSVACRNPKKQRNRAHPICWVRDIQPAAVFQPQKRLLLPILFVSGLKLWQGRNEPRASSAHRCV